MKARTLRAAADVMLSNIGARRPPYKLNYAVTYRCDSRCKTCSIWKKPEVLELDLSDIRELTKKNRFSWVNLTGGEPFLRRDIVDIANVFSERGRLFLLNMTTNGLRPKHIEREAFGIAELKIPRITMVVSLDGSERVHDSVRGRSGSWENAVDTFIRLKSLESRKKGFRVFFGYTLSDLNGGDFRRALEAVRRVYTKAVADDFHVNLFHTSHHYYSNSGCMNASQACEDVKSIKELKGTNLKPTSIIQKIYLDLCIKYLRESKAPIPCKAVRSSVFLAPSGDVYPCTIFNRKLGNLKDYKYSLEKMLDSAEAKKAIDDVGRVCPQCWSPCEAYPAILGNCRLILTSYVSSKMSLGD